MAHICVLFSLDEGLPSSDYSGILCNFKSTIKSLNSENIFTKRNFPGYLDQRLTDRAVQISAVGADKLSTDTDKLSKDTDIGSVCVCVSHWISTVFKNTQFPNFLLLSQQC